VRRRERLCRAVHGCSSPARDSRVAR
jgi:hypothetical protein